MIPNRDQSLEAMTLKDRFFAGFNFDSSFKFIVIFKIQPGEGSNHRMIQIIPTALKFTFTIQNQVKTCTIFDVDSFTNNHIVSAPFGDEIVVISEVVTIQIKCEQTSSELTLTSKKNQKSRSNLKVKLES